VVQKSIAAKQALEPQLELGQFPEEADEVVSLSTALIPSVRNGLKYGFARRPSASSCAGAVSETLTSVGEVRALDW